MPDASGSDKWQKWSERASVNQRVVSAYRQSETFRLDCDTLPGSRNVNLARLCVAVKYLPYPDRSSFRLSRRPCGAHVFGKQDRSRGSQKSVWPTRLTRGCSPSVLRSIWVAQRNIQRLYKNLLTTVRVYSRVVSLARRRNSIGTLRSQEEVFVTPFVSCQCVAFSIASHSPSLKSGRVLSTSREEC